MEQVFTPFDLKGLELKNRVVMAPGHAGRSCRGRSDLPAARPCGPGVAPFAAT